MAKLKEALKEINIFDYFFILSPFLDLITSRAAYKNESAVTLGMIVRFGFLIVMLFYLIFKNNSKYKKKSILYIIILIIFGIINLTNSFVLKGSTVMMKEIKYMIKSFYFPIMLVISLNYFDDKKVSVNKKTFYFVAMIYAILILLAFLVEKPFDINYVGKIFYPGWFFAANEVGAIIGLLAPIVLCLTINNYNRWYAYFLFVMYVASALIIATRAPVLGIFLSVTINIIIYIIKLLINKKNKVTKKSNLFSIIIVALITVLFLNNFIIRRNPFKENSREDRIHSIFNFREKHNDIVFEKYKNASIKEQILGLGYIDIKEKENRLTNNIETDFADILYPYGILGFITYYGILFVILIGIGKNSFSKHKKFLAENKLISYYISTFLMLGLAFFAGHTFLAPPVSIYSAVILSMLYIRTEKK